MEKTVSVRLKMLYDQFVKGGKEAGKAVKGIGDESEKSSKKATANWDKLGQQATNMGSSLTSKVTLPIIGIGVAAVAMSLSFDNAFQQMRATAGVADDEVEGLKESVLELSKTTGRGPQELAESLLLIRSSGFAGAEALDVLEMAAKGASAGMGETRDLANALTNVIASYGADVIGAAEAMDVLTASVQEGKAEASEMAPQFGRLLPIAAELDVSFADVAGTLAYLTRSSGDAAQSATQLQGILSKLLKPSIAGEEALKGIGESARSLRGMLDENGLLGTLVELRERLGDSGFNVLFDDVQAMVGAMQLTGSEMEEAQAVIDAVADSAGAADEAFGKWAESMGAKNSIAWAKFQAGMIQLGDQIAPSAAQLMSFLGDMIDVFSDLPGPVQKAILVFAGLAAAAGPVLSVSGNVIKVVGNMSGAFTKFGTATAGMSAGLAATATGFVILAPLMIGAGLALQDYVDKKAKAKQLTDDFTDALKREAAGMEGEVDAFSAAEIATGGLGTKLREAEADFGVLTDAVKESRDELDTLHRDRGNMQMFSHDIDVLADSGSALGEELRRLRDDSGMGISGVKNLVDRLNEMNDKLRDSEDGLKNTEAASAGLGDEQGVTAEQTQLLTEALTAQLDALRAQFDPFFALQSAMAGVRDAQAGWVESQVAVTEAQKALDEAIKEHGENSAEAEEAARGLADAENGVTDAQWSASEATVNLVAAGEELRRKLEEQGLSADAVRQQLYDWAIGVGFSKDQALIMAGGVDTLTGALNDIPGLTVAEVGVSGREQSINDIKSIQDHINNLRGRDVGIRIVGTSVGVAIPGGGLRALGGPVRENTGYIVGEKGPEWFEPDENGRIVPNHLLGSMVPQSSFMGGGGTVVRVTADMRGAVIANQSDFDRMVATAWNRAAHRSLVTVRGRPV